MWKVNRISTFHNSSSYSIIIFHLFVCSSLHSGIYYMCRSLRISVALLLMTSIIWKFVRNEESWAPPQLYWIRICVLMRSRWYKWTLTSGRPCCKNEGVWCLLGAHNLIGKANMYIDIASTDLRLHALVCTKYDFIFPVTQFNSCFQLHMLAWWKLHLKQCRASPTPSWYNSKF